MSLALSQPAANPGSSVPRSLALLFLLASSIFAGLAASAAQTNSDPALVTEIEPAIGSAPDWVIPLRFEPINQLAAANSGEEQRHLLFDRQINAQENATFTHFARQILTSFGLQNGGNVSIKYDPGSQTLTLHWLKLWRGKTQLDRLKREKIKLIQQEPELESDFIYNGDQSAVFLLEGVRVGDVIDCAYTISNTLPPCAGKFSGAVLGQLTAPVQRLRTRLLWPSQRHLFTKEHGALSKPVLLRKGKFFEFTWDLRNVPGMHLEDMLPEWYNPLPWLQLSEFQTWAEVNQSELQLFRTNSGPSPDLIAQIKQWQRIPDPQDRVRTVLDFVQEQIRYLGIESGKNAYCPTAPSVVFERRFGDCKDKTFFLVTVLRALGCEAYPALVNTRFGRNLTNWQPTPAAFDHAIVYVRLDHDTYWLDPTATCQRGPLSARYMPNYGYALIVAPGTKSLTPMPESSAPPKSTVVAQFQIRSLNQPSELTIITLAEGAEAEKVRREFATNPRDLIEKQRLNLQAQQYPGIRQTDHLEINDDLQHNKLQTVEHYALEEIWTRPSEQDLYRCNFAPHSLQAAIQTPVASLRTMPLKLRYPQHLLYRAEIDLPNALSWNLEDKTIQTRSFEFERKAHRSGSSIIVEFEFKTLADFVPAPEVSAYLREINSAWKNLSFSVTAP